MRRRTRAFTLIELLLVLFILAAIAATAASLGTEVDQQSRYDLTRARRELIRTAILGDSGRVVDGQPVVSGFVADMGRLPTNLRELLDPAAGPAWRPCTAAELFPATTYDPAGATPQGAQAAGWRGPYLRADLEHEGGVEFSTFRDGWKLSSGNADPNFGWLFNPPTVPPTPPDVLSLHSLGADGAQGASDAPAGAFSYAADLPASDAERRLVQPADYLVNLGDLTVRVRNRTSTTVALSDVAVLVLTPSVTAAAVGWTRQASARLEDVAVPPAVAAELPPGDLGPPRVLRSGAAPFTPVPWGRRSLVLVREGSDPPRLLGPIVAVTLLPRSSLPDLVLELDTPPPP